MTCQYLNEASLWTKLLFALCCSFKSLCPLNCNLQVRIHKPFLITKPLAHHSAFLNFEFPLLHMHQLYLQQLDSLENLSLQGGMCHLQLPHLVFIPQWEGADGSYKIILLDVLKTSKMHAPNVILSRQGYLCCKIRSQRLCNSLHLPQRAQIISQASVRQRADWLDAYCQGGRPSAASNQCSW